MGQRVIKNRHHRDKGEFNLHTVKSAYTENYGDIINHKTTVYVVSTGLDAYYQFNISELPHGVRIISKGSYNFPDYITGNPYPIDHTGYESDDE